MAQSAFANARWKWHSEVVLTPGGVVQRRGFASFSHRLAGALVELLQGDGVPFASSGMLQENWSRPQVRRFRQLQASGAVGLIFGTREQAEVAWWNGLYPVAMPMEEAPWEGHWVRDVFLQRMEGGLVLQAPGVAGRLEWRNPSRMPALLELLEQKVVLVGGDADWFGSILAAAGFLVREGASDCSAGAGHDRLFHWYWRISAHGEARGALYPGREAGLSPPPAHPLEDEWPEMIPLPPAEVEAGKTYAEVLSERQSLRSHGSGGLKLQQLGQFFAWGIGQRAVESAAEQEIEYLRRSYPAGGGLHEIDVFIHLRQAGEVAAGLYYYNPRRHGLTPVRHSPVQLARIMQLGEGASEFSGYPEAQILLFARMDRLNWKYQGMAYALALQNCGACLHSLYLGAAASGLAICAIGNGDDRFLRDCPVLTGQNRWWVGHLLLGPA